MRKTKRALALIMALVLVFGIVVGTLSSCVTTPEEPETPGGGDTPGGGENPGGGSGGTGTTVDYTISVKTVGGMALSGVMIIAYTDATFSDMVNIGTTDAEGNAIISMKQQNNYVVKISSLPEGYVYQDYYTFQGAATHLDIVVTSSVIDNTGLAGVVYKLGSVMRDFRVNPIKPDGTLDDPITLSELLEEKDLVLINFWYTTCSWCLTEFPDMEKAYQEYKDDIAIVALNPYAQDTPADIGAFKIDYELSFDLAQDVNGALATAFGVSAYPTSVFVDRYGVVSLIVNGAITGDKYFKTLFDHFTGPDIEYEQKLLTSYEDLAPREFPNVDMPSSEEIKGALVVDGSDITFAPETETSDAEYSWPFIIGTETEGDVTASYVYPSNATKDSSFATMHATLNLRAGEALYFEYFSSTESGCDILYIIVNGEATRSISGVSTAWTKCYPYVAVEDGEYTVSFIYVKDESNDTGDDTVYMRNMKVVPENEIDAETYIPRQAATHLNENGFGYQNYVEVFLGDDGYYHVGSDTGPLLLANLMGATPFSSEDSVYTFIYNSLTEDNGLAEYYDEIVTYCNYASNAKIPGLCTVDETLANYLKIVVNKVGLEINNPNQWLQLCTYYDKYGTDEHLEDPIAGLAPHSAFDAVLNSTVGLNEYPNTVTYDRLILPRGLWYAFTPEVSGAYRIVSNADKADPKQSLDGWIFLEDRSFYYQYAYCDRFSDDPVNVNMYVYFEAGTTYYIDIAYCDLYYFDSFGFKIEYLGAEYDYFRSVSPGALFTYEIDAEGNITNTLIAGGAKVRLNEEDGFYYNVLPDGTLGSSKIYVDFTMFTNTFDDRNLETMIEQGHFDFRKTENDILAEYYLENFTEAELREKWGDDYDYWVNEYKLEEVSQGIYHGRGSDMTAVAKKYCDQMITGSENIELNGTVAVNEELAEVLQMLMDKYTFRNVENSWVKLCYFYEHLAEGWEYTDFS